MLLLAWLLAGAPGLDKVHIPDGVMDRLRQAAFQPRQKEVFDAWEKAAREVQTLTVEFDYQAELKHWFFGGIRQGHGRLLLRRTPRGILGRYELGSQDRSGEPAAVFLLLEDKLYLLRTAEKTAIRQDLAGVNIRRWLEAWFNPFVLLLDRERAQKEWRWTFAKEDIWYSYLDVVPLKRNRPRSLFPTFKEGDAGWSFERARVVVMKKGDDKIPRNMPRQFWIEEQAASSVRFDIVRWTMDGPNPPPDKDFTAPEKMAGWKVLDDGEACKPRVIYTNEGPKQD
jgi:hypothetical protein